MSEKPKFFFKVEPTTGRVNLLKDEANKAFDFSQVNKLPDTRQI